MTKIMAKMVKPRKASIASTRFFLGAGEDCGISAIRIAPLLSEAEYLSIQEILGDYIKVWLNVAVRMGEAFILRNNGQH
jgi:hypothetical protein